MVEIVKRKRKPPVLTPSSIPCLSRLPTINITEGCASGCTYCYIQGYSHYPGPNRIVLFENTAEVVQVELRRKRRKPRRVYFSPSSDAFQYLPEVQTVSLQTMSVLLAAGIEVSFLTKGFVTEPFTRLFAETPHMVFAQVGFTTADSRLWKRLEPRTAPPPERIRYTRSLSEIGVATTARLDPLFPDLTDTEASLVPLLRSLHEAGVREAAASYVFLRPQFAKVTLAQIGGAIQASSIPVGWQYQRFVGGCGGGWTLPFDERARRFARIQSWGDCIGIRITPCLCKNPHLGRTGCGIAGPRLSDEHAPTSQGLLGFAAAQNEEQR